MDKNTLIDHLLCHIDAIKRDDVYVFKRRAHINVINVIRKISGKITDSMINNMDLTDGMKIKLKKLIKIKRKPKLPIRIQLQRINGIGPKLASKLLKMDVTKVSDLKKKLYYTELPTNVQVYVKYKPLDRIPRKLIDRIYDILSIHFKKYKVGKFHFVGSYRRGNSTSSDIDVLINKKFIDNCPDFIQFLNLTDLKVYPPYLTGSQKISTILFYGYTVKIDFFIAPPEEYMYSLLYSTGSRELNIRMRKRASDMGLLLNHKGLFKNNIRIKLKTERDIFKKLNISYIPPKKR